MTELSATSHLLTTYERPAFPSRVLCRTILGFVGLGSCLLFGVWTLYMRPAVPDAFESPAPEPAAATLAATPSGLGSNPYGVLTDPRLGADFTPASPLFEARREPIGTEPAVEDPEPTIVASVPLPVPVPAFARPEETVPLPVPRPPDTRVSELRGPPIASGRRLARQNTSPVVPTASTDIGAFLGQLFGFAQTSQSSGAVAVPQSAGTTRRGVPVASAGYDRWTAVYDISARTVYLPNGTRLEAHSGLGNRMDDPRYVHEPMRGATPPNVYALQPREQLFHGVPALRLIPIGDGELHGRNGFLAHTYMLGPNGDSNGCVSFRNYDAFLQAYRSGEVKRLVVVASLN